MQQNLTKRYYSISEVAGMFNVNISKLRYWQDHFPTINPKRDRAGDRKYTPDDIKQIREIFVLIEEEGHTIEGAKNALEKKRARKNANQEVVDTLVGLRDFLKKVRDSLDQGDDSSL
ncbi:MerR family transcriptional regulator [Flectobacillus longus]|jgi:DNA-binding transcriptional MerR regulator|uniref:MerR family transcriptional regulator n=1 Tax=Flectobacillus longus TaxID=2984207 RepID=A0ABT6YM00_9BACT|nr:MerR family transcriptional regulator [Flectobacillus longus]MDI9864208.1 MerR family transcriptional regulator [Flectobacillus longus]MDI9880235.1 MerR family transcriptional regulator [Flectobacillus longus]